MAKRIVLISVPALGHVQRAVLVTRGLVQAGAEVDVFTGTGVARLFEREGARFHDLHAGRPLESVDSTSMPIPSRFVTFAGVHGESLAMEISRLKPSLIVHGTFAVIALVVAKTLGLPRVAICSGHNQSPRSAIPPLAFDPRVATSEACFGAVRVLRERYGITNASPFSYFDSLSETLNIIPEPPEFLSPEERRDFEPCEFFGCIDPSRFPMDSRPEESEIDRIFVSFGTHSHRYYASVIENAISRIIEAARALPGKKITISLGGASLILPPTIPENVSVRDFVDQSTILAQSDIFLTHHGCNSTHESISLAKPMVSYPLFADQPGLATRCQEFGLAVSLGGELRGDFQPEAVLRAIETVERNHDTMHANLSRAREWERIAIDSRPEVIAKILACA
jgi:MGT family glycosyltransferase